MPVQLFTNNATTTLAVAIGTGDTSLTLDTGDGALFPSPTAGDWFYATLQSGALIEIVQCTARAGDVLTVVRAQEGTSATAFSIGATVELRVTKAFLDRIHTLDTLPLANIGDVSGPGSSTDNNVAFMDGATGKLIKDSGLTLSGSNTGDQTLPIDTTITTTDNTTNDASTSKHGWMPKGTNVTPWHFYRSDVTQTYIPSNVGIIEPIINGNMHLWQRGTSFTTIGNVYHADQFEHVEVSAGSVDVSRIAIDGDNNFHTASGVKLKYAMRYDVNTIDGTVDAGDAVFVQQQIEGWRALPFIHNEFTVSFFVRSNITGTFALSVRNSGADRSYVSEFTINSADTWERKTVTIPTQGPSGTWDYSTGVGLNLSWTLMAGTTFQGTAGSWQSSNIVTTSNQTNWMATATNNFDITGIQIDLGPDAKDLRVVPIDQDLAAAERYYQKTYDYDVAPGTVTLVGALRYREHTISGVTSGLNWYPYRQHMRDNPTVTAYNPNSGATGTFRNYTATAKDVTFATSSIGTSLVSYELTIADTDDGDVTAGHIVLDATL